MAVAFWTILALIAAAIHLWRHPELRGTASVSRVLLMYWLGIGGIGLVFAAAFHVFDAKETARGIGFVPWYPQSTGAFQFENAMGDLALGVAGILCLWIRDLKFWLAVILITTIQLWGDAYGHIHQMIRFDNHATDNTGPVLWADIVNPAIMIVLYLFASRDRRSDDLPAR